MKNTNRQPRRFNTSAHTGFTLIELLIVLVIMAIFTTLIVPSMASAMRDRTLSGTGKNIEEMIEFARMAAMARHRPTVLNLDSKRGLCWVSMTNVTLPWLEQQEERPEARQLAVIKLPDAIECNVSWDEMVSQTTVGETEWQTIAFKSDGTTDDAYIELTKPDEDEPYRIMIRGNTGEITSGEMPI